MFLRLERKKESEGEKQEEEEIGQVIQRRDKRRSCLASIVILIGFENLNRLSLQKVAYYECRFRFPRAR